MITAARRPDALALGIVAVAVACAVLLGSSLDQVRYRHDADEGVYLHHLEVLDTDGLAGLRASFRRYARDPEAWLWPPPYRLGYLLPAYLLSRVLGVGMVVLAALSTISHCALILVVFYGFRRRVGSKTAATIALLVGCSPLLLGLARRALTDSAAVLAACGALIALLAALDRPEDRWRAGAFIVSMTVALAIKETLLLLLLPFAVLAARSMLLAGRRPGWTIAAMFVVPPLSLVIVMVAFAGDVETVVRAFRGVLLSPATNRYALRFNAGPWQRTLFDFLLVSPFVSVLAIAAIGRLAALGRSVRRELDSISAWLFVGIVATHAPLLKNLRYVAFLEVPMRVLAVGMLASLLQGCMMRRLLPVAVAVLCLLELRTFGDLFVRHGLYDPVSDAILRAQGVIP